MLQGKCSVEFLEFPSAVGEWCTSLSENPCGKPALCGPEALETLDGFQSSVQLFVHAFNEIRRSRAIDVENGFCCDVGGELLTVLEDVLHRLDLHGIVVVAGGSPADSSFQSFLSEKRNSEDVLLEVSEETPIGFLAAHLQGSADVLEEVHMADLHDATGEDVLRGHADGLVLVAGDTPERIVYVLQLREELHHDLEVLGGCEEADGNVMCDVIHPVDEGNLLVVPLHGHILPVDDQRASKALPVAVPSGDVIVVGERGQLTYQLPVRPSNPFLPTMSECADACSLEMQREHRLRCPAVIDTEVPRTVIAVVAIDASP